MSDTVIKVSNLSKRYVISHQRKGDGLRHVLQEKLTAPLRWARQKIGKLGKRESGNDSSASALCPPPFAVRPLPSATALSPLPSATPPPAAEEFWALRDVSFEVKRGEVVGIIGRNGAGKSTLLKILSRITEPTTGRIEIDGRVASLLEVGTGFHPELTGRENIFLNGAILGMKRAEIRAKFDEIVAFAEVEQFLDTPVKRYSSGMYVRLAFAVAAHLEPEILIVDEVLAVGDAEFQSKCLGKMREVAGGGRTVLFVSHNMTAVVNLCSRAIQLERGVLVRSGDAETVVNHYLKNDSGLNGASEWRADERAIGNTRLRLWRARLESVPAGTGDFCSGQPIEVIIDFETLENLDRPTPYIILVDETGVDVLNSVDLPSACMAEDAVLNRQVAAGFYRSTVTLPRDLLNERRYGIRVGFNTRWTQFEFCSPELVWLEIKPSEHMRAEQLGTWPGLVRPRLHWCTVAKAEICK